MINHLCVSVINSISQSRTKTRSDHIVIDPVLIPWPISTRFITKLTGAFCSEPCSIYNWPEVSGFYSSQIFMKLFRATSIEIIHSRESNSCSIYRMSVYSEMNGKIQNSVICFLAAQCNLKYVDCQLRYFVLLSVVIIRAQTSSFPSGPLSVWFISQLPSVLRLQPWTCCQPISRYVPFSAQDLSLFQVFSSLVAPSPTNWLLGKWIGTFSVVFGVVNLVKCPD